jgi:hypothetical protein
VHPLCLVAVGYPVDALPNVDRYLPERIHVNRW